MTMTPLPDDFLKTGDLARTWPHGRIGMTSRRDMRDDEREAMRDWLRHVEAGRMGGGIV